MAKVVEKETPNTIQEKFFILFWLNSGTLRIQWILPKETFTT